MMNASRQLYKLLSPLTNIHIHLDVALAPTANHYIACHFSPVSQQGVSSLPHGCGTHFMHITLHPYREIIRSI